MVQDVFETVPDRKQGVTQRNGVRAGGGPARIVFWQPIDSPHQDAFLEAVARQFSGEVILGVERRLPPERAAQGWRVPRHDRVAVFDISIPANHALLASHSTADSLHVFSGFFSHPLVWSGFRLLARSPARLAIFSEAPEQPPLTGWLKRLRGCVIARRWARRFAFVLAIGGVGREFFTRIGFPRERILPCGYFSDAPPLPATLASRDRDDHVRLVSAGQLIRRKGIDLLVDACGSLPATGWRLDIYGDGPERPRLERLVARRSLADRVSFKGTVPAAAIGEALVACDCAILPSRFDGWGMLVSESLAVGTPAICTDRCGAALVAENVHWQGVDGTVEPRPLAVARATPTSIAAAMRSTVAAGPISPARRHAIRAAMQALTPSAAASRFLEAVLSL
jgi:glycosyltransferase involved in cell wall biosynthesis